MPRETGFFVGIILQVLLIHKSHGTESLIYGMDKAVLAFDMACDYGIGNCKGLQLEKKEQVLALDHYKNNPKAQMETFAKWSKDALAKLPKLYEENCQKYLSEPEMPPEFDESKELDDEGKSYTFKGYSHCLVHTLREYSRGVLRRVPDPLYFGMDMAIKAFDMACDYGIGDCKGLQAQKKDQVLALEHYKNKPKNQMETFAKWSKDALARLPKVYEEKCQKYLTDPEAPPESDESKEMEDEGKDYPFKAYCHCLVNILREYSRGVMKRDPESLYFGMDMAIKAFDMACDYGGTDCKGKQAEKKRQVLERKDLANKPKKQMDTFAKWSKDALAKLPTTYKEKCKNYLDETEALPEFDESTEMGDEGKVYPFKAYSHCLMHTLREASDGEMKRDWSLVKYGMEQAVKAYDMACDFAETLDCFGRQAERMHQVLAKEEKADDPKWQMRTFASWSKSTLALLGEVYKAKCEPSLADPLSKVEADESKELDDEEKYYPLKAYAHCLVHKLREVSNGRMKHNWNLLSFGMDQAIKAFDLACDNDDNREKCKGEQERVVGNVLPLNPLSSQLRHFKLWGEEVVLAKLAPVYTENCKKYLTEVNAEPIADESKILADGEKIYPYKAYAHCILHTLRKISGGVIKMEDVQDSAAESNLTAENVASDDDLQYGLNKAVEAFNMACDFENKNSRCDGEQLRIVNNVRDMDTQESQLRMFKIWSVDHAITKLPQRYKENCEKYLSEFDAQPTVDEGAVLQDNDKTYPYKAYAHCLISTLREVSNGRMKHNWSLLSYGLEKAVEAFNWACDYDGSQKKCKGEQARIVGNVLGIKNTAGQVKHFKLWTKDHVLSKLPKAYEEKCETYLTEVNAEPPADESKILGDDDKVYPYKAYAHCLLATLREISGGEMKKEPSQKDTDGVAKNVDEAKKDKDEHSGGTDTGEETLYYGMEKAVQAHDMACAYETTGMSNCEGKQKWIMDEILTKEEMKNQTDRQTRNFGAWTKALVLKTLLAKYKENCEQYLKEPRSLYPEDEGKELNDDGNKYPFKAYSHCLVHTLREVSNGRMKHNWGLLSFGMEQVIKAFDLACDNDDNQEKCRGEQARVVGNVLPLNPLSNQLKQFKIWGEEVVLAKLAPVYTENCKKYLAEVNAEPPADESKILEDEGKIYPYKAYAHCLLSTLRKMSGGVIKKKQVEESPVESNQNVESVAVDGDSEKKIESHVTSDDHLQYGLNMAVEAYNMACEFENIDSPCPGEQLRIVNNVRGLDNQESQMRMFKIWSIDHAISKLSKPYQENCEKYLSDPDAQPPADESAYLEDNDKTYPYKAYAHCLLATLREISGGEMKRDWTLLYYGMEKAVQAFDMVCDYENSNDCNGAQLWIMNEVLERNNLKNKTREQLKTFGDWTKSLVLSKLPNVYQEKCAHYLSEPYAEPKDIESEQLEDSGEKYFYMAYAHCLVHTLREKSKGKMGYSWDWIFYGMEQAKVAYDMACDYHDERGCRYMIHDDLLRHVGTLPRKYQTKYFRDVNAKEALKELYYKDYKQNCEKYLSDSELFAEPPADESKILEDADDDYPYKAYAHCLLSTLRILSKGRMRRNNPPLYGMEKAVQAHDMACAYARSSACEGNQNRVLNKIREIIYSNKAEMDVIKEYWSDYDDFRNWTLIEVVPNLQKKYQENCKEYLAEQSHKDFKTDEGEALHDKGFRYQLKPYAYCLVHTLREISKGEMRHWDMVYFGMDKVTVAYNMACAFSKTKQCQGLQARAKEKVLAQADMVNKMAETMKAFAKLSKKASVKLPSAYSAKCLKFLSEPNAGPVYSNESVELDDDGKIYPFKAYTHCLMQKLRALSFELMRRVEGKKDWSTLNYGMEMAIQAFEIACKYEMSISKGVYCDNEDRQIRGPVFWMMRAKNDTKLKNDTELFQGKFSLTIRSSMASLPDVYKDTCGPFTRDIEAEPKKDMGQDLKDDGKHYLFKAYAHCMVQTMHDRAEKFKNRDNLEASILAGMTFIYDRLSRICWYPNFRIYGRISVDSYFNCKMLLVPKKEENLEMIKACVPEQYHDCAKYLTQADLTHDPAEPEMVGDADVEEKYKQVVHCLGHVFRKTHGDKALTYIMKSDKPRMDSIFKDLGPMKIGIEMVANATFQVCWYEHIVLNSELGIDQYVLCRNRQKDLNKRLLRAREMVSGNLDQGIELNYGWATEGLCAIHLPEIYRDKCKIYLTLLDDDVIKPETEVLGDGSHGQYPYQSYAHCLLSTLREQYGDESMVEAKQMREFLRNSNETPNLERGIEILERVIYAICWYEYQRNYGSASTDGFMACHKVQKKQTKWLRDKISRWSNPEFKEAKFLGRLTKERSMPHLPQRYSDDCSKYLDEPNAAPVSNEGDILKDNGDDYPFKAFAYCLISTLRSTHGDNAADIVKNERIHKRRHWKELVLEQHNTLRQLHGVDPLEMNEELNQRAQDSANTGLIACDMLPVPELIDPHFHGGLTDLGGGSSPRFNEAEKDDIPLLYATEMYERVNYSRNDEWKTFGPYNFEKGFRDGQPMKDAIGDEFFHLQFTKIVWKSTKQVGLGYAYNPKCSQAHRARFVGLIQWPQQIFGFLDIRYFPKGNEEGKFTENVFPRKQ